MAGITVPQPHSHRFVPYAGRRPFRRAASSRFDQASVVAALRLVEQLTLDRSISP
jgi:hypothetical protein